MDTYHAQLQYAEYTSRMMKLGCYLFMAIVGLIGFMNLANTMIINITTKKQEYGVLQAVGMTNKQLNLSLQIQGLFFTVGTICVAFSDLAGLKFSPTSNPHFFLICAIYSDETFSPVISSTPEKEDAIMQAFRHFGII